MKTIKYLFFVSLLLILLVVVFSGRAEAVAPYGNYLEMYGGYVKALNNDQSSPNGFTFEAWVKPDSTGGIKPVFVARDNSGNADNYNYWVGINGGSLAFNYTYGNGSRALITSGNLPSGVWSHIAVILSTANTRLFINGQPVPVNTTNNSGGLHTIGPDIYLGTSYITTDGQPSLNYLFNGGIRGSLSTAPNSANFIGKIDEVRVSNIARDIPTLWNSGTYNQQLITDSNTVLLWHLDEMRGAEIASDVSGNNRSGTLTGGDSQIHFYGILPTPTSIPSPTPWTMTLPSIDWQRPVLPTLSLPQTGFSNPISNPIPTSSQSISIYSGSVRNFDRNSNRFNGR